MVGLQIRHGHLSGAEDGRDLLAERMGIPVNPARTTPCRRSTPPENAASAEPRPPADAEGSERRGHEAVMRLRRNHMGSGIAGDIQDSERSANVDHDFAPRLPCPDMIDRLGCIPERVASVDDWKNFPRLREFR